MQSGVATSQALSPVVNDQLQLGDVFTTQVLDVEAAPDGLDASGAAVGNIATVTGQNSAIKVRSDQDLQAYVGAVTSTTVTAGAGPSYSVVATANGNSLTAGTCCDYTDVGAMQRIAPDKDVTAFSYNGLGGAVENVSIDAAAVGNTTGLLATDGYIQATVDQSHQGTTHARAEGEIEQASGNIGLSATAVTNDVTVDAYRSLVDLAVVQSKEGYGSIAVVDAKIGSGADITGMATATANNINIATGGDSVWHSADQLANGAVIAETTLGIGAWTGTAQAIAYGVGNTILVDNDGPEVALGIVQDNYGEVTGKASIVGTTGGDAYVEASAVGNAISALACGQCGGGIGAESVQTTYGPVRAVGSATIGAGRAVQAKATAIGNSANYEVRSGN